jgi:two-component system nitrogen regulation response regulator NtrX
MFLQEGKYSSQNRVIHSDARIICSAVSENLDDLMEENLFSRELFYRINVSGINIPALKERREDIVPLVDYYMTKADQLFGLSPKKFTEQALAILQSYDWPGNIQQVKNVVESSLINGGDKSEIYVDEQSLPPELTAGTKDKFESLNIAKFISLPLKEAKDHFESDYLRAQIERFSGNISQTANFIGMERSALHRKLKNLKLQRSPKKNVI